MEGPRVLRMDLEKNRQEQLMKWSTIKEAAEVFLLFLSIFLAR